jgi:hypothetical protein
VDWVGRVDGRYQANRLHLEEATVSKPLIFKLRCELYAHETWFYIGDKPDDDVVKKVAKRGLLLDLWPWVLGLATGLPEDG